MNKTMSIFGAVALTAILFTGCEWTSSGGRKADWSGNYDASKVEGMNFSGTYRAEGGVAVVTQDNSSTGGGSNTGSGLASTEAYNIAAGQKEAAGKLKTPPVSGSVTGEAAGNAFHTEGTTLVFDGGTAVGTGTIDSEGNWSLKLISAPAGSWKITFNYTPTESSGAAKPQTSAGNVAAITVSQNGSSLKLTTSNGITMTGTFGTISVYSNTVGRANFTAEFSASSKDNQIVGTFDDTTGVKTINGTWTSGPIIYDVGGTAGAVSSAE